MKRGKHYKDVVNEHGVFALNYSTVDGDALQCDAPESLPDLWGDILLNPLDLAHTWREAGAWRGQLWEVAYHMNNAPVMVIQILQGDAW